MALSCRADDCYRDEVEDGYCQIHIEEKRRIIRDGGVVDGVQIGRAVRRPEPEEETVDETNGRRKFGELQDEILAALADGPMRLKDLAAACGKRSEDFTSTLSPLLARGQIVRVGRGVYALPLALAPAVREEVLPVAHVETDPPEAIDPVSKTIDEIATLIEVLAMIDANRPGGDDYLAVVKTWEGSSEYDESGICTALFRRLVWEELLRHDLDDIGSATLRLIESRSR